jgi:sugar O-acyltransferase (sialic acid O-acetyltransferase NeuD family)
MLFYGASGHAKVVIESWVAARGTVTGIFDDNDDIKKLLSYPVLGKYRKEVFATSPIILSIGSNQTRKKLTSLIEHSFANVIHPQSIISNSVSLGYGIAVMGGAIINAQTIVGDHSIINTAASVDHDCAIGNFAHVAPGAALCGGVHVGEGALVGVGATVIPEIKIGQWAIVGAGAVVIEDVPDFAIVAGNPAKIISKHILHILSK